MASGLTGSGRASDRAGEEHALRLLEFDVVLDVLAERATSELGRRTVRALRPLKDVRAVDRELAATDETVGHLLRNDDWIPPPVPDVEAPLRRLRAEGSILSIDELLGIQLLLASSRSAGTDLSREPDRFPLLAELAGALPREPDLEDRLARTLDEGGGLADGASRALRRIRSSLRGSRADLVRRLEAFIRSLPSRFQVPDASVTLRSGRYCIPVRREGLSHVGGIVHDESDTHQTLFVEPPEAIERMNRIAELERDEAREVQRILREISDRLRPVAERLLFGLEALARADALYALGRYALEHGGERPTVEAPDANDEAAGGRLVMVQAFHPLLRAGGEQVVPFDLALEDGERALLVSGPNAGGKTVLLKAIGLLSAMTQAGVIPPVGAGTRLPLFRRYFAVIGDEQSIEASLSTFSAQVDSLRRILEEADDGSLVLVDELGGSTDPSEGAALAGAVLLRLAGQAGLTVATTHLGRLKQLAAEQAAIVNASLQFDTTALRPTYHLVRDRPGRSYALEIAQRLGMPESVLEVARSRLSAGERRADRLLKELEAKDAELSRLAAESLAARDRLARQEEHLRSIEDDLKEREGWLRERERQTEREAVRRAERYLIDARRDVAAIIDELRERVTALEAGSRGRGPGDAENALRDARSGVERLLRATREREPPPLEPREEPPRVELGGRVRSRSLGLEGRVSEVRDDGVVLEAGGMRFTLRHADVEVAAESAGTAPQAHKARPADELPEVAARSEVDLRGLRVEEVAAALEPALDAAVVCDLPSLRVIHGKGTGALREEVRRLLVRDARVRRFRPGGFEEGGSGVTVVEFEKADR